MVVKLILRTDLQRAVCSWGFVIGAVSFCLLGISGVMQNIVSVIRGGSIGQLQIGYTMQMMLDALGSDAVLLFLPVLCALPHTAAFVEDFQSKYYRVYLPRSGKRQYIGARLISTIFSGGLAMLAGALLLILLLAVVFKPMEEPRAQALEVFAFDYDTYLLDLRLQLAGRVLLLFLSGCFWSCVGGFFACLILNKYMAYAAPFILYYVLIILEERYFSAFNMLNPKLWMNPLLTGAGTVGSMALFVTELTLLMAVAYGLVMTRRMKDA